MTGMKQSFPCRNVYNFYLFFYSLWYIGKHVHDELFYEILQLFWKALPLRRDFFNKSIYNFGLQSGQRVQSFRITLFIYPFL